MNDGTSRVNTQEVNTHESVVSGITSVTQLLNTIRRKKSERIIKKKLAKRVVTKKLRVNCMHAWGCIAFYFKRSVYFCYCSGILKHLWGISFYYFGILCMQLSNFAVIY